MHPSRRKTIAGRILAGSVSALLALAVAAFVHTFAGGRNTDGSATYSHGVLRLAIPYRGIHGGSGRLTLEVLDPEDHVLGRIEKTAEATNGPSQWEAEIKLEKRLALDDLVWHRVRYRFHYDDNKIDDLQGAESVSAILRLPILRILGQQSYLSRSRAAVRVIVSDSKSETIPGRSTLRIDLESPGKDRQTLFTGQLNHNNTVEAQFQLPDRPTGNYALHYTVDTSLGSTEYTQTIRLEEKVGVLLTTDKTIYQPGQRIHVRALALDRADHRAVGKRDLLFEVEDSHGNKVFK